MKEQMRLGLFILFLFVTLLQPVAGMDVGFSICDSETPDGLSTSFTLSPTSSYFGTGGSPIPVVTQTPIQKDAPLLGPATTPPSVVTTPKATQTQGDVKETIQELTKEEVDNVFYIVCFGIVFTAVIVIVGVFIIRKNRNL